MPAHESKNFFTREISPVALKFIILILFILVFVSLGLNWYLIQQLLSVRQQAVTLVKENQPAVSDALTRVEGELAKLQEATIEFNVDISEELPVAAEIPINETIEVPIQLTVPIKEQIQTTIMIDPLQAGLEIPVDIDVPVEVEVPIDVTVPVVIDRTLAVSTSVPIDLDFPVVIEVRDTELAAYIEQLRQGVSASQQFINRVATEITGQ